MRSRSVARRWAFSPWASQVHPNAVHGRGPPHTSHQGPAPPFRCHVLGDARYIQETDKAGIDDEATVVIDVKRMLHEIVACQLQRVNHTDQIDMQNLELWLDRFLRVYPQQKQRKSALLYAISYFPWWQLWTGAAPSILKASSGPLIPALATTISMLFLGEFVMALLNNASWSSQEVTSHGRNIAFLFIKELNSRASNRQWINGDQRTGQAPSRDALRCLHLYHQKSRRLFLAQTISTWFRPNIDRRWSYPAATNALTPSSPIPLAPDLGFSNSSRRRRLANRWEVYLLSRPHFCP